MRALRDAALRYVDLGWSVIPLHRGQKQPATRNGKDDASDDLVRVFEWWQPTATHIRGHNVGIVCNDSGLVVLDVDPRHGGDDTFRELEVRLGSLPQTVEAETGGGGWHYLFRHPGGVLRGQLGPGLDVKAAGYIVAPPSVHPSGRQYEWSVDGHPDEVEVAVLPQEWIDAIQISSRSYFSSARTADPQAHTDPLRLIPAHHYVSKLTGRTPDRRGWYQCPFHAEGQERTPSLKVDGNIWACYACPVPLGKQSAGGNIYSFQALLMGRAAPPRGADYLEVKAELLKEFG